MKEMIINKFPNCIFENSSLKIVSNIKEEYYSLRYGVALRINNTVIIQLKGKDSLEFLHRISTNDVKNLQPNKKKNTLFLNEKGRFIDRTTLLNFGDYLVLVGLKDETKKLINWINKYIITEEIETYDMTDINLIIEIIGPQAESFLTLILGEKLNDLDDDNIVDAVIDNLNFKIFVCKEKNELKVYKILISVEQLSFFVDYILNNKCVFDLKFIGDASYQIFRVEKGLPDITEINLNFNPHEIDLTNEISFTKGCYIGQEVIARLETYDKVQRKLSGIIFNDEINLNNLTELMNENGEMIGYVTTTVDSELLNKKIGLAVLKKNYLDKKEINAFINNSKINLSIVNLPFAI
ncbi:MAG: hypothetical protein N2249_01440 [Melioribacter sp.]|nr:hypothetical protein [Melioribacter sp.]